MEQSKKITLLKEVVVNKVLEMVDCAINVDKLDFFEINLKHVNGELITKVEFSDKDKVK